MTQRDYDDWAEEDEEDYWNRKARNRDRRNFREERDWDDRD